MSFTPNPALVPDRDNLPLKKRDQRRSSPPPQQLQQQQQCDAVTFKAPYPYKSHSEFKTKHTGPFQPVPKRVPALYQPWMQTSTRSKPQVLSAFREHHGCAEWRDFNPLHLGWDFSHHYQHHSHFSGTPAFHPGHPLHRSRFSPVSLVNEGFQRVGGGYGWEQLKTLSDKSLNTERESNERNKGPYVRRRDRKASSSSSSPNHFPWLLPHFVAGSLIELRDGRLRRVEHLQTEDFMLGSLACPDLHLSCCTVQSISPSAMSSISRLLILLHDQQTQELVDVYMEYPFFVRGRGWSSCSPQRTARLCGLQCRQLSVGDVCLALTPVSAPRSPPSATPEPMTSPRKSEEGCESLKAPQPNAPPGSERPAGEQKKEVEGVRRRHYSAPELRGPGTNCM
ncbi:uncharacterized protein LOC121616887 isoform X2 [Chelmon rostratus]|uniref:uncharacterized protein LOC121616887 isoform X2 n=1 Tax=Chelmon rostratus TaxID=109905 RepID=UPI001BE79C6A|nr:uncharacterized protein LOC121616887 isoform X2 [Chelmon rostratus]